MRVAENGHLRPMDHLLDDHMMRISNPSALSYTEFDGRGFVAVSGADNGLSVFELLPDGLDGQEADLFFNLLVLLGLKYCIDYCASWIVCRE